MINGTGRRMNNLSKLSQAYRMKISDKADIIRDDDDLSAETTVRC